MIVFDSTSAHILSTHECTGLRLNQNVRNEILHFETYFSVEKSLKLVHIVEIFDRIS